MTGSIFAQVFTLRIGYLHLQGLREEIQRRWRVWWVPSHHEALSPARNRQPSSNDSTVEKHLPLIHRHIDGSPFVNEVVKGKLPKVRPVCKYSPDISTIHRHPDYSRLTA